MFSDQITAALKVNHGEQAKCTYEFLSFINNHIIKTFTTVSWNKSFRKRDPFCSVITNAFYKRLMHAEETSIWLIDSWYPFVLRNDKKTEYLNDATAKESEDRNVIIFELVGRSNSVETVSQKSYQKLSAQKAYKLYQKLKKQQILHQKFQKKKKIYDENC